MSKKLPQPRKDINVAAKALSDPAYKAQVIPNKKAEELRKLGRKKVQEE